MKSILRGSIVAALVFGLSWQLFAEVPKRQKDRQMMGVPQELQVERLQELSEELNLTSEQKEKLSRITKERKQERVEEMAQARKELQKKHMERLSEDLQLTTAQAEKISQVMEDGWQRIAKEREKMTEKVRSVRVDTDKRIEKILKPKQREKFEILKKQRMEGSKRQRPGVRGNRGMMGIPPESE